MTDLIPTLSFNEKIKERIRDSFGELLTDEDLQKIVENGVNDILFAEGIDSQGRYNHPPLVHTVLKEILKARIDGWVKEWLNKNSDELKERLLQLLDVSVGDLFLNSITRLLQPDLNTLKINIDSKLFKMGENGLYG